MGKHYTDPLAFILDGAAESESDGRCTDLEPSRALQRAWGEWGEAVTKALLDWGDANGKGDGISDLITLSGPGWKIDVAYDVYMTLDGAGVGMWDGRWDPHLDDASIEKLQHYLGGLRTGSSQGVLGPAFNTIEAAIHDEAEERCGYMRGTRIEDDDLNGALSSTARTKLDLILDRVSHQREVTIDISGYTRAQVDKILAAAKARGLHAAASPNSVLIRDLRDRSLNEVTAPRWIRR